MADLNTTEMTETTELNNNENAQSAVTDKRASGKGGRIMNAVRRFAMSWFPIQKEEKSREARVKMPLPIVACLATIALSLTLIVGSSAMISAAHRDVTNLQSKVDTLAAQANDLAQDLNDRIDLLQIRNVAVNEYGMISEEFISMRFLNVRDGNAVESYRAGSEPSAILGDITPAN